MLDAVLVITLLAALAAFATPTRQHDTPTEARTEAQRVTAMLETGHIAGMSDMVVRS